MWRSMSSCVGSPSAATAGSGLCAFAFACAVCGWTAGFVVGAGVVVACAAGFVACGAGAGFAECVWDGAGVACVVAGGVAAGEVVAGTTGCVTAGAGVLEDVEEPPPFIIVIAPTPSARTSPTTAKILIGVETCVSTDLLSAKRSDALKE